MCVCGVCGVCVKAELVIKRNCYLEETARAARPGQGRGALAALAAWTLHRIVDPNLKLSITAPQEHSRLKISISSAQSKQ